MIAVPPAAPPVPIPKKPSEELPPRDGGWKSRTPTPSIPALGLHPAYIAIENALGYMADTIAKDIQEMASNRWTRRSDDPERATI